MMLIDILHCTAVRHNIALKAPFPAQDILEKGSGRAGGFPVDTVIGAHHGMHAGLLDSRLKRRKIGQVHILAAGACVKVMAVGFRSRMYRKMLGCGVHNRVLRIRALQSFNKVNPHT